MCDILTPATWADHLIHSAATPPKEDTIVGAFLRYFDNNDEYANRDRTLAVLRPWPATSEAHHPPSEHNAPPATAPRSPLTSSSFRSAA
jgi:hypothetical protein